MSEELEETIEEWFYEENGERKGPITRKQVEEFITSKKLSYGSLIWNKEFTEWKGVEITEFGEMLKSISPPPLTGSAVKNNIVWILAFAPIIGTIIEYAVATILWGEFVGTLKVMSGQLAFISLLLNIGLSYLDEKQLVKAGCDTSKFKGFVWLVPVYLYQRSEALKQSKAYFITWIVTLVLVILGI